MHESVTIPGSVLFCTGLAGIACAALPVAAALRLHKKMGTAPAAFFWGCGAYLILPLMLGQTLSGLAGLLPFSGTLWFAVAYSALSVALLNLAARLAVFHWALKDDRSLPNAVQFGLGFGWTDALLLLAIDLIFTTALGLAINRDPAAFAALGNEEMLTALTAQLNGVKVGPMLASAAERLCAVVMQAALAVLMMVGVGRRRPLFTLAAFGLEAACLAALVWLGEITGSSLLSLAVRVVFTAAAVLLAMYSKKIWDETDAPITGASAGKTQTWNAPLRRRPLD
ncbi:MAG: YhfC family intramembrane metalloprotease [Oscillospiraceae bacterium]|nr:YhfC family intramembrane metalloprotease [Oscillospiraceae bacterium]